MAIKRGRCKGYGGCRYADDRQVVEADEASFVCPGCGSALTPERGDNALPHSGRRRRTLLAGGALGLAGLAIGGTWWALGRSVNARRVFSLEDWVQGNPPAIELEAIRGDLAQRATRIAALKSAGQAMGTEHGLLEPVPGAGLSTADLSLLERENRDRRNLYAFVASHVDPPVSYERVANVFAMRRWREWPRQ